MFGRVRGFFLAFLGVSKRKVPEGTPLKAPTSKNVTQLFYSGSNKKNRNSKIFIFLLLGGGTVQATLEVRGRCPE